MDREELIKRLEKLTPTHKILILILSFGIIIGGYWYFFYKPASDEIKVLTADIEQLDTEITKHKKTLSQMPKLEKELEIKLRQFGYAKKLLPEDSVEKEKLLADIEKLGRDEAVEFRLFQPGKEEIKDFYATTNIKLNIHGEFHNLIRFYSRMSALNRLVSLQDLRLNPLKADAGGGITPLNAQSEILLYRALTDAEIKAQQAAKKKKGKKK